ncbi:MAG: aldo/keto reductase [Candidatus Thorarchaeota archaeon]|nr:MAG: aldo/keto reductase [Candidatus Thorarchaeota archaeon]
MSSKGTTRRLGKTDIEVSSIGLGAMQFSGGRSFTRFYLSAIPTEIEDKVVKVALESGINWIDTAEVYGSGESERAVAHALTAAGISPGDVVIATKWLPIMKSAKSISRSAEKSTRRLEPYPIDLYLVHQPYSRSSVKSQMDAMADLVDSNIIRAVGVSNFSSDKMTRAHEALSDRGISLATNQVRFSLLDRRIESNGILERAKELGVTITAYTPLGMGLLTGKLHSNPELFESMPRFRRTSLRRKLEKSQPLVDLLEDIAVEQKATAAQVALSWATNYHGDIIVAIPGASKTYQAEQNAGAMHVSLSSEQMNSLSTLSRELS